MRFFLRLKITLLCVILFSTSFAGDFTGDQYTKALWMATRFYGGQRSGEGPNWLLMDSPYPTSFVKDSYNGQDISGGWFDCGDHVMFGQTQFYSAYVLALAMSSFPNAWPDLYSADYSGYEASQDFSINGGTPNGIPDIIDELRYEADFIVKITPNANTFISQKGSGTSDHQRWVTAGKMATLSNSLGGEFSGPRSVVANPNDGNMPGQAAAMLAVMARHDPDPSRRSIYLQHAMYAYDYAKNHDGLVGAPQFYNANKEYMDARFNAATELWKTTGNEAYKTEALSWASSLAFNGGWRLDFENDGVLAIYNAEYVLGASLDGTNWQQNINTWLYSAQTILDPAQNNVSKFTNEKDTVEFPTRGPLGFAFMQALVSQATGDTQYDSFIEDQVDYVLGSNTQNHSYVFGFTENGKSNGSKPHHRNIYGNTNTTATPGDQDIPVRNQYFGALQGGALDGSSNDDILDLSMNEPCIDLNATLVGALAYIVSKTNPSSQPIPILNHKTLQTNHSLEILKSSESLQLMSHKPMNIAIFSLNGQKVFSGKINHTLNISISSWNIGVYQIVEQNTQGAFAINWVVIQ